MMIGIMLEVYHYAADNMDLTAQRVLFFCIPVIGEWYRLMVLAHGHTCVALKNRMHAADERILTVKDPGELLPEGGAVFLGVGLQALFFLVKDRLQVLACFWKE